MSRGNYLPAPHAYNLQLACAVITEAYGPHVFLVGSCLEKREYRDVDVRCMLDDEDFDKRFPKLAGGKGPFQFDPEWSLLCASISLWLEQRTGLPIDFQFQRFTQANEEYGKRRRNSLGMFLGAPSVTVMDDNLRAKLDAEISKNATHKPDARRRERRRRPRSADRTPRRASS